jgi:hypothetical protein
MKINFVPEGTAEWCGCFPASFQDANSFWMIFQPLRSWLISGVPLGQVRIKFHEGGTNRALLRA